MNEYKRYKIATLLILTFLTMNTVRPGPWAGDTPIEIVKSNQVGGKVIGIKWKSDNTGFTFAFQSYGGYSSRISDFKFSSSTFTYTIATDGSSNLREVTAFSLSESLNKFALAYDDRDVSLYNSGTSAIKDTKEAAGIYIHVIKIIKDSNLIITAAHSKLLEIFEIDSNTINYSSRGNELLSAKVDDLYPISNSLSVS